MGPEAAKGPGATLRPRRLAFSGEGPGASTSGQICRDDGGSGPWIAARRALDRDPYGRALAVIHTMRPSPEGCGRSHDRPDSSKA
jgi:hypothetical protein